MNSSVRISAFIGAVALCFGASWGVGSAVGPVLDDAPSSEMAGHGGAEHDSAEGDRGDEADHLPGGLAISQDGYTLELAAQSLTEGAAKLKFAILDDEGEPLTSYTPTHDKELHLIAVRRDTTGFQHVHPVRAADGTWSVPLSLSPGDWRIFADFAPPGTTTALTLGADLSVAGAYQPVALPSTSTTSKVDDYTVTLTGELGAGHESALTLTVSRNGKPVTDLEPYLAAYGHLVALRSGDLAYLHVHPAGTPGDGVTTSGPAVTFYATAPSAGKYRLFLDFKHNGVVRTAEFTVQADGHA